ncbi:MAG TPA: hypothetical protein V6D10_07040 [Trichocoleus sp.]
MDLPFNADTSTLPERRSGKYDLPHTAVTQTLPIDADLALVSVYHLKF